MNKEQFLEAHDLDGLLSRLDTVLEDLNNKQNEMARFRHDNSQLLPSGNSEPMALQIEESRLMGNIQGANESQRRAALIQAKLADEQYQSVAKSCTMAKLMYDQLALDVEYLAKKWLATMEAAKQNRAILNFLAES